MNEHVAPREPQSNSEESENGFVRPVPILSDDSPKFPSPLDPLPWELSIADPPRLQLGIDIRSDCRSASVKERARKRMKLKAINWTISEYKDEMLETEREKDLKYKLPADYVEYLVNCPAAWKTRAAIIDLLYFMKSMVNSEHSTTTFYTSVALLDRFQSLDPKRGNEWQPYWLAAVCFTIASKINDGIDYDCICEMLLDLAEIDNLIKGPLGELEVLPSKKAFYELESLMLNTIHFDIPIHSPESVIGIFSLEIVKADNNEILDFKSLGRLAVFIFNFCLLEPHCCVFGQSLLAHSCVLVAFHYICGELVLPSDLAFTVTKYNIGQILECAAKVTTWLHRKDRPDLIAFLEYYVREQYDAKEISEILKFLYSYRRSNKQTQEQ